jgi:hypothetical protein
MTLTPYLILVLAGFGVFVGVLGVVSIWSKGGDRRPARVQPAVRPTLSADAGGEPGEARTAAS